jgi:catechol-2,3-dioxygenase
MPNETVLQPTLHHINLKTTRLQEMIDWYGTVVGMRVSHRAPRAAWLTNDGANHRLALLAPPELTEDPGKLLHAGLHHLAFEYPALDDLLGTYRRLKAQGIVPHACLDHGMTTSFYYVDPDGNSVELQYDSFGDWALSSEFVRSAPEFAADPIGRPVDPERMAAARAGGASADEIHRLAYSGAFDPGTPLDLRVPLGGAGPYTA